MKSPRRRRGGNRGDGGVSRFVFIPQRGGGWRAERAGSSGRTFSSDLMVIGTQRGMGGGSEHDLLDLKTGESSLRIKGQKKGEWKSDPQNRGLGLGKDYIAFQEGIHANLE